MQAESIVVEDPPLSRALFSETRLAWIRLGLGSLKLGTPRHPGPLRTAVGQ